MARSTSDIQAELDKWYAARARAAEGKSVTFTTSAGTRTWTSHDLPAINEQIRLLERELSNRSSGRGRRHDFAVARFQ